MTALASSTTTSLAPGTRVRITGNAMWGINRGSTSDVAGMTGTINSGPDSDNDYSVTAVDSEGDSRTHWVGAEYVLAVDPTPDPDTYRLPLSTRVYILPEARWSQGRVGRMAGGYGLTMNNLGPDRDGDYLVRTEDETSSCYVRWQDVRLEEPAPTPPPEPTPAQPDDTETLRAAIVQMQEQWDALSEALNSKARDQDWCSEYESVVQPLGLEGRVADTKCWEVSVSVNFTYEATLDDTSTQFDSQLSNMIGDGVSLDTLSIEVSATRSVTVHIDAETSLSHSLCCEDCVKQYLDQMDESLVESALDDEDVSYSSIDGFDVDSVSECGNC